MIAVLAQRQLSLAAAALIAAVAGLAIASGDAAAPAAEARLPQPALPDRASWYTGHAAVRTRPLAGRVSGCGTLLDPTTLGVGHSVLPCGAKVFLAYRGRTVLTTVVDRGPLTPSHDFEVTPALADLLDLSGIQPIRWSFAR